MNDREKPSMLRLARLRQGYRLTDVARMAKYPISHLSGVERGLVGITMQRLVTVANVLKLTDEELGRVVRETGSSVPRVQGRKDRRQVV
ncbi:helix-turn-helix transcriptional regulator [Streptomyces sp. NBC_01220]|uniref:helix-turn-helix domain-containing protein n=1 Tax=Streptomyces sp. NBC_01220 TaxID=2903781 RepID=UPI00352FC6A7|nr:helix-turn-helix transcriptional regulator [Streptomyces sp. NBC_01220]